jgi:hypothetical protein
VSIITVLLIAPAVLGDFYTTGDWQEWTLGNGIWTTGDEEHVMSGAVANSQNPFSAGGCDGWAQTYTTESGTFSWYAYLYAGAVTQMSLWDNMNVWSMAWAGASASGPGGSDSLAAAADTDSPQSGEDGTPKADADEPEPWGMYFVSVEDVEFTIADYVRTECYAVVDVERHSGTWGQDQASAQATAIADAHMYE